MQCLVIHCSLATMKVLQIKLTLAFAHLYFIYEASVIPKFSDTKLHFDRFDGICRGKNPVMIINYTITKIENRVIYFNITLDAKEDILGKPLVNISIFKCKSKENLDTCEDFLMQKGTDYCSMIDPVATRFGPWFIDYKPQYKCPIKKGKYVAYNSKLDTFAAMVVPLESWYWKGRLDVYDEKTKRLLQCTQIEAHLVRSTKK